METKETDEVEKLKSKLMSAWHNVKYSWVLKSKTAFSRNSPVFLLGKCYHFTAVDDESPTESFTAEALDDDVVTGNADGFRKDFTSRVWLTYREEFPTLPGSTITSDCGWGCTLRAGQMILAQALLLHILGRGEIESYCIFIMLYSADVIDSHSGRTGSHSDPQGLNSEAAPDSRAVIILIPVRLGGEKINPEYLSFVKSILSLEYCIGIIGGKPKQAYYFVGFQDDSLIYMDPHYCQSFVDVSTSDFPLQSFHCPSPKKMPFSKMDPSCTIGFYSKNVEHYERISTELSKILQPSSKEKYPAFTFMKGHGKDYELSTGIEKREWPFIRDTRKAGTTLGDFVLL
uniref:Cysteine protease n=1 Tax=Cyprinus carpio TaxID=7962 RepID=A0A8C2Q8S2_CYPCA